MPHLKPTYLKPAAKPLSREERDRCARVGHRLMGELQSLMTALPGSAATIRGMADCLGINRNITHAIHNVLKVTDDFESVLGKLPGEASLGTFINALKAQGPPAIDLRPLNSALEESRALARELAGTKARLVARLGAREDDADAAAARSLDLRRRRFELEADILGSSIETRVVIDAYRPLENDPSQIEHAYAGGSSEVRTRRGGVPFISSHSVSRDEERSSRFLTLDGQSVSSDPNCQILTDFSSSPVPGLTSKGSNLKAMYVVDHDTAGDDPISLFLGRLTSPVGPHPAIGPDYYLTRAVSPRHPVRRLVLDSYLHRSMAQNSVPSAGAFLHASAPSPIPKPLRWFDRLPNSPRLELLGRGFENANCTFYPRQKELTETLFERLGWPEDEFVGYRLVAEYLVAGTDYAVSFDFTPADS